MKAILRIYQGEVAFIGEESECNRLQNLLKKWGREYNTEVLSLFDDGMTYYSHCFSLYLQHNRNAWRDMENLFERTKKQGKSSKTIDKKINYFKHHLRSIIREHQYRLLEHEEADIKRDFYLDEGFFNWWVNYYFSERDLTIKHEIPLYKIGTSSQNVLENVLALERNNNGIVTPPKFTVAASDIEVFLSDCKECWVKFEWKKMDDAFKLMDLFKSNYWHHADIDFSGEGRRKLNKLTKDLQCRIDTMDTPYNLYQQANNWFYIYFHWNPSDFTWKKVKKVESIVKKLIVPHIKRPFLPMGETEPYTVTTLTC